MSTLGPKSHLSGGRAPIAQHQNFYGARSYGGAGLPLRAASVILETIHVCGGNAAACHAQMYIMGTLLRHGSEAQKQTYLMYI